MECDLVPFDGDVACRYGISYSSVMGKGIATIVEDSEEKQKGLKILMKTQVNKDFEFNEKLASVVAIIKIEASEFMGKLEKYIKTKVNAVKNITRYY